MSDTTTAAIVFGGASGIGRACALALAQRGAPVVIADPNEQLGREAVAAIETGGGSASFIATDVTDEAAVERAIAICVERHGALSVVVSSAGANNTGEDAWHRAIDLFLKGPYYIARHSLPALEANGGGCIVLIGSISSIRGALNGGVDRTGYPSAKHGLVGLAKSLALAYGEKRIRVNVVCPGYIKTPLTKQFHDRDDSEAFVKETLRVPLGRWGEPEDIGGVVGFLASDEASYISGQTIVVDGGMTAR
jgi:NAD(P)-dependent dehydrogenase (short-subunit alcohol dehydrogenase family)